jgi:hypothetical protein
MRRYIFGLLIIALILSFILVIAYLSPAPPHGVQVEMTGWITPKTLERGLHETVYGIHGCNKTYYTVEVHPLINESSLLILKVCFENDCKTYRKVLKGCESLILHGPCINENESLNISISGSLISTTTNEKIEEGKVELRFIGICK